MGLFKRFIEQGGKEKSSDEIILRQAIIAELDAINLYQQMSHSAKNKQLKKVLLDIADEEKIHVGEFEAMLNKIDASNKLSMSDGKSEVEEIAG